MKKNYLFNVLFLAVSFVPCLTGTAGAAEADVRGRKCYTLRACTQNSLCIQEEADGSLTVAEYAPSNRCFWEFVPTGQPNRFYIRNLTTGITSSQPIWPILPRWAQERLRWNSMWAKMRLQVTRQRGSGISVRRTMPCSTKSVTKPKD